MFYLPAYLKLAEYPKSKTASLGPLETVRISVNLLGWFVLHRPPVGMGFEWPTCAHPTFVGLIIVLHKQ
ncbi:hypothetical protein EFO98_03080 [Lactiplantibacillus argentoratensis]|uniref:Uncharacterized protein n=1 Tax=Lactiplantibacillus argentoratensis TaxID=271881 RepID=A0AAN1Q1T0_9LACO|nr:hypothetical protein D5289_06860 [Lactiplantibacillus plantarum]AYJ36248.1 hypothetical protein LPA65_11080 [Lactiplantibacillus argentoratensis]MCT4442770.1 hypothetical protein [Lactiplantibacillus argentoratensis]MPQ37077.1 hypothetical protein [Lactiplantibacillus plantarum]MZU92227.1 hypothetical protein [Lactiplantibacillus plantarum]